MQKEGVGIPIRDIGFWDLAPDQIQCNCEPNSLRRIHRNEIDDLLFGSVFIFDSIITFDFRLTT